MVDDNEDSDVVDGLVDDTARGHHAGDDRKVRYQPSDLAFVRPDYTDDYAIDERADNVLTNEFPRWRDEEWFLLGMVVTGYIDSDVSVEDINDAVDRDIEAEILVARRGDLDLESIWKMHDCEAMWERYA